MLLSLERIKNEKISKKKDQGWENIGTISLTSPIEAIMKKYLFLFQALKMYSYNYC